MSDSIESCTRQWIMEVAIGAGLLGTAMLGYLAFGITHLVSGDFFNLVNGQMMPWLNVMFGIGLAAFIFFMLTGSLLLTNAKGSGFSPEMLRKANVVRLVWGVLILILVALLARTYVPTLLGQSDDPYWDYKSVEYLWWVHLYLGLPAGVFLMITWIVRLTRMLEHQLIGQWIKMSGFLLLMIVSGSGIAITLASEMHLINSIYLMQMAQGILGLVHAQLLLIALFLLGLAGKILMTWRDYETIIGQRELERISD